MKMKTAQEILGISRPTLIKKINDLGLDLPRDLKGGHLIDWGSLLKIKKSSSDELDTKPFSLAICQNKGGVGKTTLSINLGYLLSKIGKTLMIDLDGQSNLSQAFGIYKSKDEFTLMNALEKPEEVEKAIVNIDETLDLIPNIQSFDSWKKGAIVKLFPQFALRKALKSIKDNYKFIIVDCPPSLDLSFELSVCAVDYQLIILDGHIFSLQGLENIFTETKKILDADEQGFLDLKTVGIVFNKYVERSIATRDIINAAQALHSDLVFDNKVRELTAISKSQIQSKTVFEFENDNPVVSIDLYNVTLEILKKINAK